MNINKSAHILCALNADKSNYVDLIGGGDLRMQYNTVDNLRLTGRYTLNNGDFEGNGVGIHHKSARGYGC